MSKDITSLIAMGVALLIIGLSVGDTHGTAFGVPAWAFSLAISAASIAILAIALVRGVRAR